MTGFDYFKVDEYQLEITTYCNAACPQCPRNINGGEVNPYLNLQHQAPEAIDIAFLKNYVQAIRQVSSLWKLW